ncbi:MAG TPA: SDR family NAD(P)-dependent oxidoreductase [Polyangiaceae bacterium]
MPKLPTNARAVVTGAGSGFGRAITLELASRGATVIASDVDLASAEETAKLAPGGSVIAARADVRSPEEMKALIDGAADRFGGLDVMVNNAGVAVAGAVGEVPLDDWHFEISINLYGVIHGCHFTVPIMKKQKRGFILNVASAAGLIAAPLMGPYNVTKAGVIALSETLRTELEEDGVAISVLCPTFFRTNIHKSQRSPEKLRATSAKLVEGAKWSAEQIARVALRGLERGELYIIPQTDGKMLWRAKRALGGGFYSVAGKVARRRITET